MPQSTVSRHLRVLREAGLISDRREGVAVYCRVATEDQAQDDPLRGAIRVWLYQRPLPRDVSARVERCLRRRRRHSSEFFDHVGSKWDNLRSGFFGQEFPLEAVLGLLPHEWVVADLGTGTGYLLGPMARAFARVIAVDHNELMLARARRRVLDLGITNVDLRHGELEKLPIETGSVDLAVAMLVLHHVGEPARALAEAARILRSAATLLVVELAEHQDDDLREAMGDLWMGFSPERLSRMASEAGFVTDRVMPLSATAGDEVPPSGKPSLFALMCRR